VRRDAASGAHSMVVLRPLRAGGVDLQEALVRRFHEQLPDWLIEPLDDLEVTLVAALLEERARPEAPLNGKDCDDLWSFAAGRRGYASAQPALRRLTLAALGGHASVLDASTLTLLVRRVLQRRSDAEVAAELGLAGRGMLVERLRDAGGRLLRLSGYCPAAQGSEFGRLEYPFET
jgi:tRNA(Met) cytidine acetyltransferase